MTFGFGCAFLLLCGLSVENRSFWLVRRMPTFVPDRNSQYGHFEDDEGTGPEKPLIGHGDMEEFHGNGEESHFRGPLSLVTSPDIALVPFLF
uniref:Putative conserved secreted protein n=1 Tax=Ixodes ricinus TaxID=34613 RepID=A0A6B0U1H8_IXORI